LSDRKDDFAELRTGFQIRVGGGSFGEPEDAVNDGLEAASGDELHYGVQLGLGAHVGGEE